MHKNLYSLKCRFNSHVSDVVSGSFNNTPALQEAGAIGYGDFSFDASFYSDDSFSETVELTDVQMVGETVFFGISPSTEIVGMTFAVRECYVTDGRSLFPVYENFCPNPVVNNDVITQDFETADEFQLSYQAFQFSGNFDSEVVSMTMNCAILICLQGNCPVSGRHC